MEGSNTSDQTTQSPKNPYIKTGIDYPTWKLFSTPNTFTITPSTQYSEQRSLIVDKKSLKIKEHAIVVREDAEWTMDIQGLLGILNILGVEHIMVITGREEVCKIPHKLQPRYDQPSVIFELQEVELIPFENQSSPQLEYQLRSIRDGIKKFLEVGFYLSYRLDLTSNTQRRDNFTQPKDGQVQVDLSTIHPYISLDYRYMWNYNLFKQLRSQHIPAYWIVPLVQGYVGHSKINDLELVLIARRRWLMGGTRYNSRGIDEEGNTANCVESEQIIMRHVPQNTHDRIYTYSFSQIRGSIPFFWQQPTGKIEIHRSLESSTNAFTQHAENLMKDYEGNSILMVNLLCKSIKDEEMLTQGLLKLKDQTKDQFEAQNKKIDYEYFDFHYNYCLDRTNVFQSKICFKVFEDLLKQKFSSDNQIGVLLTNMWAFCGDFISKIYAGTHSVLTQVTLKGKENIYDKIDHGVTSVRRFLKQNLSDDFKQECILVLQGQHELCNSIPTNFVESVVIKEIDQFSENQKIILHITTLNCAGKSPEKYQELIPIFKPQFDGVTPIFQGKNKSKMNEWEQILRNAIEAASTNIQDPDERYVWVIAKAMVGCFIGLFVKQKLLSRIKDLKTTKIKTGLGGSAGNKGAVIVRFSLDDTSILLMNCHLMSGKNKGSKRTDELNFIFDNAFKNESKNRVSKCHEQSNLQKFCIENHNMVFIFGDLNYRICLPNDQVRGAIQNKDYPKLKEADELLQAFKQYQNTKELQFQFYRDYDEGEIDFQPTYKYDKKSQKYDTSKKQRVPSWCDRILWKKNNKVTQQVLGCFQDIVFSDHRPVFAQFELYVNKIMSDLTNKMEEKFYENMRFQSLHALGKNRMSNTSSQTNKTNKSEEQKNDDGTDRDPLDNLDEQLSRYSSNTDQRRSENPLIPLIEEGDEEEMDPQMIYGLNIHDKGDMTDKSSSLQSQSDSSQIQQQQNVSELKEDDMAFDDSGSKSMIESNGQQKFQNHSNF
ncbi:endonuclease exonuclease phosphatase family protein [Stylonychia lemnae]|uniref:phosphoinositide 5-phosphatase n=1 Tax=Stylonychia lemnae TaxID=5949 RepID=A0A078ASR3_STYLE|nr:endonuclease exonuclease phosphatase family protein [Stylonychia lemnae]|eukprot:CDW85515.1 endonuclease exonuclease phosphatase family protein [Stylonychia lemnae]